VSDNDIIKLLITKVIELEKKNEELDSLLNEIVDVAINNHK